MKKPLIVYYSWSCGNTERIAKSLQSVTGGNLVRLDTAVPYSGSYNDVVDQGQREVNVALRRSSSHSLSASPTKTSSPSARRRGGTRWLPPSRHSCVDRILQARPLCRL